MSPRRRGMFKRVGPMMVGAAAPFPLRAAPRDHWKCIRLAVPSPSHLASGPTANFIALHLSV